MEQEIAEKKNVIKKLKEAIQLAKEKLKILKLSDEMLNEKIEDFRVALNSNKKMVAIQPSSSTPSLGRSLSSNSSGAAVLSHQSRSIMISAFSQTINVDSPEVYEYFSHYGEVVNIIQIASKSNRRDSYQFGFLKFKEYESATNALGKRSHMIGGYAMKVKEAKDF